MLTDKAIFVTEQSYPKEEVVYIDAETIASDTTKYAWATANESVLYQKIYRYANKNHATESDVVLSFYIEFEYRMIGTKRSLISIKKDLI